MVDDAGSSPANEGGEYAAEPPAPPGPSPAAVAPRRWRSWKTWAALAVPAVAIVELAAFFLQVHDVVPPEAWDHARDAARTMLEPSDGLLFSPRWTEPLGRMHFGDKLATLDRMAPQDYTRFPRVLEVSIRGQHRPEVRGWSVVQEQRVGPVSLRLLANPHPVVLLDDLLTHVRPQALTVVEASTADGSEQPCPFADSGPRNGALGFGPAIPAAKFNCPRGGPVALTVVADLDYYPHHCIYAPPPGSGAALRLRFSAVHFGKLLYGHHGLYVEAERMKQGAPINITFRVGDRVIGEATHEDGQGWDGFQFDTSALQGTTGELTVDVQSSFSNRRMYCFEADTRS